jgi:hypothetical protein
MVPAICALECCQEPRPWKVEVRRVADGALLCSRVIEQPYLVVGREAACDLTLDHPFVAETHLYLHALPDRIVAVPLFGPAPAVLDSPRITLGEFQVSCTSASDRPLILIDQSPSTAFKEPVAIWQLSNARGNLLAITERRVRHGVTLIGRGPACRFRIDHASMSPIHASLVATGGQLQVLDVCSRAGVRVNGERVKFSRLRDGDELAVGACCGRIRLASPAEIAPGGTPVAVGPVSFPGESRELVLDLLHQFLAMHQTVLEQTERLMAVAAQRLDAEPPRPVANPEHSSQTAGGAIKFTPAAAASEPHQGELHAWLNGQLANLEPEDEGGLASLWKRLRGA